VDDCILTDWPLSEGYGRRNNVLHHRKVWEAAHDPIPAGLEVRHLCDNPACVNLDHLRVGTHAENMRDRHDRLTGGRGMRHGKVKLTDDDVLAIRASPEGCRALGRHYGVSHTTISGIRRRKYWRHLP
jgi:hypothetical protein